MPSDVTFATDPDHPVITRIGRFVDRDTWPVEGIRCSMERALDVVGTRSAMVLLREAFFGVRRFDDLVRRTGLSDAVAAARLKQLAADGLLAQEPYREPGARTRYEYVLTDRGRAIFPALVALLHWGDDLGEGSGAIELFHAECGGVVEPVLRCAAGHEVSLGQTSARQKRSRRKRSQ